MTQEGAVVPSVGAQLDGRPSVFISFSSADLDTASAVAKKLTDSGLSCFFARWSLEAGDNFALEIVKALSTCDVVVLLLSVAAAESPHVRREVSLAIDERRLILPFAMPGTTYPVSFSREWTYWLSAVQVAPYAGVDAAYALVQRALQEHRPARVRPGREQRSAAAVPLQSSGERPRIAVRTRSTPSALLRAELDAIALVGREEELLRLQLWASGDDGFDVRLITGGAGQGKTRLAHELARQLESEGWSSRFVQATEHPDNIVAGLPTRPVLLVVDYAESRVDQVAALLAAVADVGVVDRTRLLLLARSRSEWWRRLKSRSAPVDGLLEDATVQPLKPLVDQPETVELLYRSAFTAFAEALGRRQTAAPALLYRHFPSVLDVIEAALADVLVDGGRTSTTATSQLLSHERRQIQASADADGLTTVDTVDLDRFSALYAILGASDEREAVALLECTGIDLSPQDLRKVARLFHRLYPGSVDFIDGLRPDALATDFISEVIEEEGTVVGLTQAWSQVLDRPERLRRGLTTLARAAAVRPAVRPVLRSALDSGGTSTLLAGLDVATQVEDASALVDLMTAVIGGGSMVDARELLRAVPEETVNLADLAAVLAAKVLDELAPLGRRGVAEIETLLQCSNRFSDAGWGLRAATTVQEAIQDLERLAGDDETVGHLLASALSNLSNRLWEIGDLRGALDPAERAVEEYRRIPVGTLELAAARNNLVFRLTEVGELVRAHSHATEVESACRTATADGVRGATIFLASALNNLSCVRMGLRSYNLAAAAGLEAVSLRRAQAQQDRDRFLPYVARALANAAPSVDASGDHAAAVALIAEARALHVITGRRAPIFRYEEVESATVDAVMWAISGDLTEAGRTLDSAAGMLTTVGEGPGELVPRLAQVIEHNRRCVAAGTRLTWDDVQTVGSASATRPQPNALILPQLLEFKDL